MSTTNPKRTKSDSPLQQNQYQCSRAEVARELGITVQRVAQIERRALTKLRLKLLSQGILKQDARDVLNRAGGENGLEYTLRT